MFPIRSIQYNLFYYKITLAWSICNSETTLRVKFVFPTRRLDMIKLGKKFKRNAKNKLINKYIKSPQRPSETPRKPLNKPSTGSVW